MFGYHRDWQLTLAVSALASTLALLAIMFSPSPSKELERAKQKNTELRKQLVECEEQILALKEENIELRKKLVEKK